MVVGADFAGFEQAQVRLRANFGREVEFFAPTPTTWPPGVPLDPETGRPFDVTIAPLSSGWATASAICNVVDRPMGLSMRGIADSRDAGTALGDMSETSKVFIVASGDVALASGATRLTYLGESFKVTDFRRDALGPVERYLAYAERE